MVFNFVCIVAGLSRLSSIFKVVTTLLAPDSTTAMCAALTALRISSMDAASSDVLLGPGRVLRPVLFNASTATLTNRPMLEPSPRTDMLTSATIMMVEDVTWTPPNMSADNGLLRTPSLQRPLWIMDKWVSSAIGFLDGLARICVE